MEWWERPSETQDASASAHLFVCQHGLWGSPEDVSFLEQYLQHNGWLTLNARSNSARCTFDGADVCGDRLAAEVVSHVHRLAAGGVTVTHISFAAYSFGGLIARYAVGKLLASGFFSVVCPVNFLTIASPHLGCWEHPSSMSQLAYNSILPWTLSRTGRQLLLADRWLDPEGLPLLAAMARPDLAFHAALAAFQKRVLLADIRSDRTVPYTTAAITAVNPYLGGGGGGSAVALSAGGGAHPAAAAAVASCGCAVCGPRCAWAGASRRGGFEPLVEEAAEDVEEEEDDDDEDEEGAAASDVLRDGLGLSVGGGSSLGASAGGLLRGWANPLGLGSVLRFGMGVASLLFGGSGGRGRRRGGGAWRDGPARRCGCPPDCRCGCAAAAAAAAAPAMIPLPISSSYPCIVTPHPAPVAAPAAGGSGAAAAVATCSSFRRPGAAAATATCALHRSASSPLPKLRHAAFASAGGGDGNGDGGASSSIGASGGGGRHAAAARAAAGAKPPPAPAHRPAEMRASSLGSGAARGCGSSGGSAAAVAAAAYRYPPAPRASQGLPSSSSGDALFRLHQARQGRWYDQTSVARAAVSTSPLAAAAVASSTARGGGRASGGEEDDALASRVRLGLFVALLPVLLSLWLCMVAWLAAIWIHHYAVLLTVRPDRSWDVRVRRPTAEDGGGGVAAMAAAECRDGGNGVDATRRATDESDDRGGGDGGLYDGGGAMELCMSLTEAPPPSSPSPSPLLLQRRTMQPLAAAAVAAAAALERRGPSCESGEARAGVGGGGDGSQSAAHPPERTAAQPLQDSTACRLSSEAVSSTSQLPSEATTAACGSQPDATATTEIMAAAAARATPSPAEADAAAAESGSVAAALVGPRSAAAEAEPDDVTAIGSRAAAAAETPAAGEPPAKVVGDADADASAAVDCLVRTVFESVVRRHGEGRRHLAPPAPSLGTAPVTTAVAQTAEAEEQAEGQPETEEMRGRLVRTLTRSLFRTLMTRPDADRSHVPDAVETAPAGASNTSSSGRDGSAAAATAAVAEPRSADQAAVANRRHAPPAAQPQSLPSLLRQHQHGLGPGGPAAARSHDPAALLAEMIANLNQLDWQKVDVDTRHYHAHAAIVVRSSRRFRSHMHIIDYAVRQLKIK